MHTDPKIITTEENSMPAPKIVTPHATRAPAAPPAPAVDTTDLEMVIKGLVLNPELIAWAAGVPVDDKIQLGEIIVRAREEAAAKLAPNLDPNREPAPGEVLMPNDPRRPAWIPKTDDFGRALMVYRDGVGGPWRKEAGKFGGQYILPKYAPGKPGLHNGFGQAWQRVTTFIGMAEYAGEGLQDYTDRHTLKGLVTLIQDGAVSLRELDETPLPDKHRDDRDRQDELKALWRDLADECHVASGKDEASQMGSEVHAATELIDLQTHTPETLPTDFVMPDGRTVDLSRWRRHVEAYIALRDGENGFQTFPEMVERVINPSEDDTVGTVDRYVLFLAPDWLIDKVNTARGAHAPKLPYWTEPRWVVADIKSGDVDYRDKMGRQLLTYARAEAVWSFDRDEYEPLPDDICQEFGLIVHIPWHDEDPQATLIPIPFVNSAGIEGLEACSTVKRTGRRKAPVLAPVAAASAPRAAAPLSQLGKVMVDGVRNVVQEIQADTSPTELEVAKTYAAERSTADPDIHQARADRDGTTRAEAKVANFSDAGMSTLAAGGLNGLGQPLAPLAGPGKRGCGVCGRTGHRKGSPACLGDRDPSLAAEPGALVDVPDDESRYSAPDGVHDETEHPDFPGQVTEAELVAAQAAGKGFGGKVTHGDQAWCQGSAKDRDGWTQGPNPGDPYVCNVCLKPSRAGMLDGSGAPLEISASGLRQPATVAAEQRQLARAAVAIQAAEEEDDVQPDPLAHFPKVVTAEADPWVRFLTQVAEATTTDQLKAIAVEAHGLGFWDGELKAAGKVKMTELTAAGR